MFDKILVPLDGSDLAEGILPYVTQLAKGLNSQLILLAVLDSEEVEIGDADTFMQSVETQLGQRMDELKKQLQAVGVQAGTAFSRGKAAEEIVRTAESEPCGLIAMSTHGRSMLGRGVLGSVTDKVIHSANIPVLTITPDRARAYSDDGVSITKIMAALDGSPLAETILPYVEELAREMSLKVSLVRVLRTSGVPASYLAQHPYQGLEQVEAAIRSDASEYLTTIENRLIENGLDVEQKLLRGAPAVAILDLAKDERHDLICLATHGRSGITRWVMGSVAETLVRASNDPVLVIPPGRS